MKTTHTVLETSGNTKKVQVDLIAESSSDEIILNRPFTKELQDHVLLYANSLFPDYSVLYALDSSNSPKRTVVLLQKANGF